MPMTYLIWMTCACPWCPPFSLMCSIYRLAYISTFFPRHHLLRLSMRRRQDRFLSDTCSHCVYTHTQCAPNLFVIGHQMWLLLTTIVSSLPGEGNNMASKGTRDMTLQGTPITDSNNNVCMSVCVASYWHACWWPSPRKHNRQDL